MPHFDVLVAEFLLNNCRITHRPVTHQQADAGSSRRSAVSCCGHATACPMHDRHAAPSGVSSGVAVVVTDDAVHGTAAGRAGRVH